MTFGSLFTGIGGFDLGLERAGLVCRWQVEIERYCQKILEKHWPEVGRWDDVCTFPPAPARDRFVDLIVGGDPCQENSNARQGAGLEQSSLGDQFIRVLDLLRPRLFLRENPSHVRADAPWPWWRFRSAAESLGYAVLPFRVRACCFGADHQRERLLLLGERTNAVQTGLEGNVIEKMARAYAKGSQKSGLQVVGDPAGRDRWDAESRICRVADGIPNRVDRLKGLGNAVVPQAAEWIGRVILSA